ECLTLMLPVVFDLDGTLIDSLPNVTDAVNGLLAEAGLPSLSQEMVVSFVGRGERVLLDRLIAATDLNAANYDGLLERFIEHYKCAAEETRVFPGVMPTLESLRNDGFQLALCTNKPRAPLIPTLEAAGLNGAFDVVIAGDDLEKRKPDPTPLLHIVSVFRAQSCVYVGDSDVDAETARRADVPFLFFTEGIRTMPIADIRHDAAFSEFSELPELVRRFAVANPN
ncbi:MAG: phosphoglycolate phosphatase, partial [Boseongicola sp.]